MRRWWCLMLAARLWGVEPPATLPAGSDLEIRVLDKLSSEGVRLKQRVRAVVIAPVVRNGRVVVPQGALVSGVVARADAVSDANPEQPAELLLQFDGLRVAGPVLSLHARVYAVDNARETVDGAGTIVGINPHEAIASRLEQGIGKLKNSDRYSGLAGILETVKGAVLKDADPNINFDAGVEMTLRLTKALAVPGTAQTAVAGFEDPARLSEMVNAQPFRTYAQNPHRASDITNVMLIGSEQQLTAAFTEAGWSGASQLNGVSKFETAVAIIDQRGFKEAPVSVLTLGGRLPDLVFQKGNDTFSARHHLRVWRSPDTYGGRAVWVCSSTHDIGIDYSRREMTFIHKIDSNIDAERAKVMNDLTFTGNAAELELVGRPEVPRRAANATGDDIVTDGKIAVMLLR